MHAQFADYGKNRQAAVVYHLEQLRMLLLPTQVTKMCMWSLHQDDEFYDEEKNQSSWGGGIWNILCKELNVRGLYSVAAAVVLVALRSWWPQRRVTMKHVRVLGNRSRRSRSVRSWD